MPHITITSDFGSSAASIAAVKGKLYRNLPDVLITDISHSIKPFDLQQAAYLFQQTYTHFPDNTFHFILNDLYSDPHNQLLYAYENKQHIFCANNGLMTLLFNERPAEIFILEDKPPQYDYLHILDVFIDQVLYALQNVRMGIRHAHVSELIIRSPLLPTISPNMIEVQVLMIDHFGNIIFNIQRKSFEEIRKGRHFAIRFMRDEEINTISQYYHDVPEGNKLCLFNASGYLEIAIYKGNAAMLLGMKESIGHNTFYNTVKIFFE